MPTKTELIWDGKYDACGNRVAPLRVALPFQTVETVNESSQDRQLNLFQVASKAKPWRNRLIWGDKKYVLPSLLPEFAGKVDLIYIDPPFDTGADFSFTAEIPGSDDEDDGRISFLKQPSIIEQKAYRDIWGQGVNSYFHWFYNTVVLLQELLSESGSIYVHLDWHVVHYAKAILDEFFGPDNFQNEIIWKRTFAHNDPKKWGRVHDTLLLYTKAATYKWNNVVQKYDESYVSSRYKSEDKRGKYHLVVLTAPGVRQGDSGKPWRGMNPTAKGRH